MKIRFNITRTVKAVDGETYEEGKVYDLSEASARRWLRRGVAVEVSASDKQEAPEAAARPSSETAVKPSPRRRTVTNDDA